MSRSFLHPLPWCVLALAAVLAADDPAVRMPLTIKDHRFVPAEVHVPAGKAVVLELTNQDDQAEEFESHPLGVEKVIPAGGKVDVRLRPLKAGTYPFVGEYHEATAKGSVVAE
jgi:heme/copper-type cytochrome/quinol oxidase subunit 2